MSRLEKHKQKEFYRKVGFMVGLLVILLLFMFFVGFQLLLNGGGYVGKISRGSEEEKIESEEFYGIVNLDELPTATNSAQVVVSGSLDNYKIVEFYINNKKVKTKSLDSDTFTQEIGLLNKGKNEVFIKALSEDKKHEKKSSEYTITYKNEKPKLEISEPGNNSTTNKTDIIIAGKTDLEVFLKINDSPAVVDAQGSFRESVRLKEGENKFTITAEDDAGNLEKKELTIKYDKDA